MTSPKSSVIQKAARSVNDVERKLQSNPVFCGLIIVSFILYSTLLVLTALAFNETISGGLFINELSSIPIQFILNFTPSAWSFCILSLIHALQLSWVLYSVLLTCRSVNQEPAYLNPIILSPAFFIFFNLSTVFNIGWLFLWDKLLFLASFVFLACLALSLILSAAIVSSRLKMLRETMLDQDRSKELKFLEIIVINSLAMNITWTVVVAVINFSIILVHTWHQPITNEGISITCIGVFIFFSVLYIGIDSTVLDRYTRYSISPYAVIIWTLAASLAQNYNPSNLSSMMSLFLIGAISLAFLFKLGFTLLRSSSTKGEYQLLKIDLSDDNSLD